MSENGWRPVEESGVERRKPVPLLLPLLLLMTLLLSAVMSLALYSMLCQQNWENVPPLPKWAAEKIDAVGKTAAEQNAQIRGDERWSQPVPAGTKGEIEEFSGNYEIPVIQWEALPGCGDSKRSACRAEVPGGWIYMIQRSEGTPVYVPNPDCWRSPVTKNQ